MHFKSRFARPSRAAAIRPLAVAASALLLAQCGPKEAPPPPPAEPAPAPPAPPAPTVSAPSPAVTRAELLAAFTAAAEAYAVGTLSADGQSLAGRNFAVTLPFGCFGPSEGEGGADGIARWAWGPDRKTIVLSLTPADWRRSPLVASEIEDKTWEAVRGFWIARPWLRSDSCPAVPPDGARSPAAPSPQTAGVAAVFEPDSSRFGRGNRRGYSFTLRPSGDAPLVPPVGGYRVVLEGRLVAFPDAGAIRCRSDHPDRRPVCIAAAQLDRVAFLDGATGEQISEWRRD